MKLIVILHMLASLTIWLPASMAWSASDMEADLANLEVDDSQVPQALQNEHYYSLAPRPVVLSRALAIDFGGGKNFSPSSYAESRELSGSLRFFLNDRFFLSSYGSYVFNNLSAAGKRLWEDEQIFPDVAFVKRRMDGGIGIHTFYGKLRFTMNQVHYFDQYIILGGGAIDSTDGEKDYRATAAVVEAGFSFWFGRYTTSKLGLKAYNYREQTRLDNRRVTHYVGQATVGLLLGGGRA